MHLHDLPELSHDWPAYAEVLDGLNAGTTQINGLPPAAKALTLAQLARDLRRPLWVVTYNSEQAAHLCADLARYGLGAQGLIHLPSSVDTLLFGEGPPDLGVLGRRTAALVQMARGDARIVVGPIAAWTQKTPPSEALRERVLTLTAGHTVDIAAFEARLTAFGYERVEAAEQPGQWTRRGGIVDIFPGDTLHQPFRLDFFGDELESIRPFDVDTQRSLGRVERLTVAAVREMPFDSENVQRAAALLEWELPGRARALRELNEDGRGSEHAVRLEERVENDIAALRSQAYSDSTEAYLPYLFPDAGCALGFLPADAVLVWDEPQQARARWEQTSREVGEIVATRAARGEALSADYSPFCAWETATTAPPALVFSLLGRGLDGVSARVIPTQAGAMEGFGGRVPAFLEALDGWLGSGWRCVLVSEQAERLRALLAEGRIPVSPAERLEAGGEGGVFVLDGGLLSGLKLPEARLMVATDTDIFGHRAHEKKPRRAAFRDGLKITSYLELREGDYVVHVLHGIGRYAGLTKLKGTDGAQRDYLLLEYAEGDKVYVPADQVDRVQKYIGSADAAPEVTRLHSGDWARATRRAQKQVQEMAADLIKLYAARKAASGHALPPDTPWQTEMEDAFPYEETPDQQAAIDDVKRDLEADKPMDRLICGDVGYGKTEVAIRAAFKVVNAGRQVAILCPTTILAQQHLGTFRERLASYPVKIEMLSRFVSRAEAAETLRGLADGAVDIVIGTHKLLGKDVKFARLGLLVVDEEQRFGVTHKERIKQMKKSVDVLTLTATPIPRTLHMSLSGIRDMSLIDDPPEGRKPIKTVVREYDDELVREVILRELDRGGQVYFLHNRIESISHVAQKLRRLVPQAKVEIAHGQMHEDDLEDAMLRFSHGDFNVLVCTTIVESGLDIPNVNTIVVDNADRLGLAQLYQLRGRIGRSDRQGYAYLLFRKDKQLTEVAEKRLSALREFSDLGSGYKVALRDLEIRGAGNLLGAAQSGTVATVGFDLYTQLLSHAINELKGEDTEPERELPTVTLPMDALLPSVYIPSEAERILMYKKLAVVRQQDDVARIQEELEDRYGDPPKPVWNLLALLRLRLRCSEVGISSIVAEKRRVAVRFSGTHLMQDEIKKLARAHMQHQFLPDVVFLATSDAPAALLRTVEEMVEIIAKALPPVLKSEQAKAPPRLPLPATHDKPDPPKPKSNGHVKAAETQARNLVTHQISARRRGR